jgi:hypothetical protein
MVKSIDDWDRYELVRYLEEQLHPIFLSIDTVGTSWEKTGVWKIRVTSIKETVTRKNIFVHYEIVRSTSRFKNPEPDRTHIFNFDMVESHMKSYERDIKLKEILVND